MKYKYSAGMFLQCFLTNAFSMANTFYLGYCVNIYISKIKFISQARGFCGGDVCAYRFYLTIIIPF